MRIMLDVGSRNGESLAEFVEWEFDIIHAFEPMAAPFANLVAAFGDNPKIEAHNFGLSDATGPKPMYGTDDRGEASVFASKSDLDPRVVTECKFVKASEFFAEHVLADADVLMKLNCEGSEIAIIHDLLDSGQFSKVRAFRVEFDISRCGGHEGEADALLARLDSTGFDEVWVGSDARMVPGRGLVDRVEQIGSHRDRIRTWLEAVYR